jgi:Ca2+-transporting ATPase
MVIRCHPVHAIRGRVRLRVEDAKVFELAPALEAFLGDQPGIREIRLNRSCRSIVIAYDPERWRAESLVPFLEGLALDRLRESAPRQSNGQARKSPSGSRLSRVLSGTARALGLAEEWVVEPPLHPPDRDASPPPDPPPSGSLKPEKTGRRRGRAVPAADEPGQPWHVLSWKEALRRWDSSLKRGLTDAAVRERLVRFGPNALPPIERRSRWSILAEQFQSLPVVLLLGSAALSVATGGLADAAVILGVVLINAGVGHATESQAEETISALQGTIPHTATVLRQGARAEIAVEEIVPGDILVMALGTFVAADARLIEAERLMVDESTLTGESMPVTKDAARLERRDVPLRDRLNMVYRGTVVTGGSGLAVVVATGRETEVGRVQRLVGESRPPETPTQRQLRELGTKLAIACGATCGGMFLLGLARGYRSLEMLKTAVALGVAAVPEGLPTVAAMTLALGVERMRRQGVLIRHLDAVETLGSVQVFCLDKTGTITLNRMAVTRLFVGMESFVVGEAGILGGGGRVEAPEHDDLRRLLEAVVLCNEAAVSEREGRRELEGSPTEASLLRLALDTGIDVQALRESYPLLRTEYRTETRGFMSTLHASEPSGSFLVVKGRPADVLDLCRRYRRDGACLALTAADRARIKTENDRMAGQAQRVLGVACREGEASTGSVGADLVWLGLVGIEDPIRPGLKDLIWVFHRAGIRTTMITGDQSATAYAIGKALDLGDGRLDMVDSTQLERIDPEVLKGLSQRAHVFSAVSPSHKLQIVRALQHTGLVVAMTGDGINDGPALKAADIGVAMGARGAEVARSVADVVLEDDDLRSMIAAIRQGRTIHANTRHAIHFLLATNLSEVLVMLGALAAGAGRPLDPIQLLWINLLTDIFPVLTLAVQPPEPDVLDRPPCDPHEPILRGEDLSRIGIQSAIISAGSLLGYGWGVRRYGIGPRAGTIAFHSLTAAQYFHILSARSETHSILTGWPRSDGRIAATFAGGIGLQLLAALFPRLRRFLGLTPLGPLDATVSVLGAVGPFLANEAIKSLQDRRPGAVLPPMDAVSTAPPVGALEFEPHES